MVVCCSWMSRLHCRYHELRMFTPRPAGCVRARFAEIHCVRGIFVTAVNCSASWLLSMVSAILPLRWEVCGGDYVVYRLLDELRDLHVSPVAVYGCLP